MWLHRCDYVNYIDVNYIDWGIEVIEVIEVIDAIEVIDGITFYWPGRRSNPEAERAPVRAPFCPQPYQTLPKLN